MRTTRAQLHRDEKPAVPVFRRAVVTGSGIAGLAPRTDRRRPPTEVMDHTEGLVG